MAVTASCKLSLSLVDFRRAIAAVNPHAVRAKSADDITALSRIRFCAGKDELHIMATNGSTSGMASVRILEDSRAERFAADDGTFSVDISPVLAVDLRSGLRMQRGDYDEDAQVVEVTFTEESIAVRDVSGLWPGSTTTRPTLAFSSDYPPLFEALRGALGQAMSEVKPLDASAGLLKLFLSASLQYDKPLRMEPVGPSGSRGFVVWCGPRFIGHVQSSQHDDDSLNRRESERRAHLERLLLQPTLMEL